jgi:hypothetical protein
VLRIWGSEDRRITASLRKPRRMPMAPMTHAVAVTTKKAES